MRIRAKLLSTLLLTGLVPLGIIAFLSLQSARDELMRQAFDELEAVKEIKKNQLESYLRESQLDAATLAQSVGILRIHQEFSDYKNLQGITSEQLPIGTPEYEKTYSRQGSFLHAFATRHDYYDVFVLSAEGQVLFTVAREDDLGANLASGHLTASGLGRLWKEVMQAGAPRFVDFAPYAPSGNAPAAFVGAPIMVSHEKVGVLALQLSHDRVADIMQERAGMGRTGETFLVGSDHRMRSDSFHDPVGHSIRASFAGSVAENGVATESAKQALQGKAGMKVTTDFDGTRVLSAYGPVDALGERWAILAEINYAEIQEPIERLGWSILLVAVIIAGIVALVASLLAARMGVPIATIANLAQRIAQGDVEQRIEHRSADEIGNLAASFRDLIAYIQRMAAAANRLAGGNLATTVHPNSKADVLSQSFASMTTQLRTVFGRLREQSQQLSQSGSQLSSVTAEVSRSVAGMSSNASSVASAAEEMSVSLNSISDSAEHSSGGILSVASATEEMTATVSEIARSTESTRQISDTAVTTVDNAAGRVRELGEAAQ